MSLLKRNITDLKSGKYDEHARAAAVYRGKGNVQRELDSVRQAFIETAFTLNFLSYCFLVSVP